MSFSNKVDYMPNQPFSNTGIDPEYVQHKKFQKRKWQVLIGTFLLILIAANAVIWSQEKIYQSQAIIHFSYTSQTEQEFAELAQRQITLHQQRLKSNGVLSQEDLEQLLVNTGHDAQVAFPEQLSLEVLRHTYLTYLASQGARLNDIELVAGYTSPSDLALYRNVNQKGKLFDLEQIQTQYPFVATS